MGVGLGLSAAAIIAIIGASVSAVGIGVGTWQAVEARRRQEEEANLIAEEKEKEKASALESAAFAEQQHRRRISLLAGKQAAVTAASGVSLLSASALGAESDLTIQGELEALQIRRGGQIESQAKDFEARLARYRASTARAQVGYDIAGGVLSGASSGVDAYSSYKGYNYRSSGRAFTSLR